MHLCNLSQLLGTENSVQPHLFCGGSLSQSAFLRVWMDLHVWGHDWGPLRSVTAAVCFYRQLQKLLLWTSVIPAYKSQTPPATAVLDEATDPQNQTRHTVFCVPSAATGPQSVPSSFFLHHLFFCLLVQQNNMLAGEQWLLSAIIHCYGPACVFLKKQQMERSNGKMVWKM